MKLYFVEDENDGFWEWKLKYFPHYIFLLHEAKVRQLHKVLSRFFKAQVRFFLNLCPNNVTT